MYHLHQRIHVLHFAGHSMLTPSTLCSTAVGVGEMLVDNRDLATAGMKGKGIKVLHLYRDKLWYLFQSFFVGWL